MTYFDIDDSLYDDEDDDFEFYLPKRKENPSPQEFLDLPAEERLNLKRVRFVPPRIDEEGTGFGYFKVEYEAPVLRKSTVDDILDCV